jgi:YVTN family beta-propeller protein
VIDCHADTIITILPVGEEPCALVYNPVNRKIYCANRWSNDITVIEAPGNAVMGTISVGHNPVCLYYKYYNKVYCANFGSDNVTVIDAATDEVTATLSVGDGPCALDYNWVEGKIYCANRLSDDVTVINSAVDTIITQIAVGDQPRDLVYNEWQKVYCVNQGSNTVSVIECFSDTVLTTIAVGNEPVSLVHGWYLYSRIYVSNYSNSSVSVIREEVGIEEDMERATPLARYDIMIFPNPAKTFFTVNSRTPVQNICIYDILGGLIRKADLGKGESGTQISIRDLSSGVYFLKVHSNSSEIIEKLIVAK